MKRFEIGKSYKVNGGGQITITKRTKCFITYTGDFTGKRKVIEVGDIGLFGMGEVIWIPYPNDWKVICGAEHEA